MTTELTAAIIGLGPNTPGKGGAHSIAYCHAWAMTATPGVKLIAGCSRNERNVNDFAAEFPGVTGFQDYRAMLKQMKPELVSVCAFAPDREEMVMACLDAGARGVLIEKPFALSLGAARKMMAAAQKTGARLFVNHQRRYGKPFELFKDAAGKIGDVLGVDIVQPFGNALDFGPHLIDAALFALGEERKLATVFAAADWTADIVWQSVAVEKHMYLAAHFEDGARLTYEAGKSAAGKLPVIRMNGTLGFAEMHLSPAADAGSVFRARLAGESGAYSPATDEHFHHSDDPALYMKRAIVYIAHAMMAGTKTRIYAS